MRNNFIKTTVKINPKVLFDADEGAHGFGF